MSKVIGYRLGKEPMELAQVAAEREGISRNRWIVRAIDETLGHGFGINNIKGMDLIHALANREKQILRIPNELAERLDKEALRLDVSRTLLITLSILRKLCDSYL